MTRVQYKQALKLATQMANYGIKITGGRDVSFDVKQCSLYDLSQNLSNLRCAIEQYNDYIVSCYIDNESK